MYLCNFRLSPCVLVGLFLVLLASQLADSLPTAGDADRGLVLDILREKILNSSPGRPILSPKKITHLSWTPRAAVYKGFLSQEECDYIIELARPRMARSMVVDPATGEEKDDSVRTSNGMFIMEKDPVIERIEHRIATWTFLPKSHQEAMQVLRYDLSQEYSSHTDYFEDAKSLERGQRFATVLMYLSNVTSGGETAFALAQNYDQEKDDSWSECGKSGMAVKPSAGDALLFWSLHPNNKPDPLSEHAGCPVMEGEKWSATKWIHIVPFDEVPNSDPLCIDRHTSCLAWAVQGECEKNPAYMTGDGDLENANCAKSCEVCPKSGGEA